MVERRSPKPSVEVRFLVGPLKQKTPDIRVWSFLFQGDTESELLHFREELNRGREVFYFEYSQNETL